MKGAKEQWVENELNNPKNWITRNCAQCGSKIRVKIKGDQPYELDNEPVYCSECSEKLFSSDD